MKHNQILRRGLSILLSLVLCLSLLPATALAEGSEIKICGTTLEEGKAYAPNDGGIAEKTDETNYLEYNAGELTVHGSVTVALPASSTANVLKLESGDLTISCPEGSSLTLDGQNSAAAVSLQSSTLTLTGAGDVTIQGSETAVSGGTLGGTLKAESYSGDLAISAAGNSATVNHTVLNLDTTGNISITGSMPVAEGLLTVTNAADVTITGSVGNLLPYGSVITDTGSISIESESSMVVNGLTVNNAEKVTLTGNTTSPVAMSVTLNNCESWDIINKSQTSAAPLAINITVDGTTYGNCYGVTVTADGNGTASASLPVASAGTNITLSATANEGYRFKEWEVVSGSVTISGDNKFTMPGANVTVKAIFEEDAPSTTTYTVRFDANGGSGEMTAETTTGSYTLPTCTFAAPEGKQFKGWATSASGTVITDTTITVTEDTTLYAVWEDISDTTCDETADFTTDAEAALALLGGTEKAEWDSDTSTLTLKGVDFTTSAPTAVRLPDGATIVLADGTENTIANVHGLIGDSVGIRANGNITIQGSGTLTVTAGTAAQISCGIYADGNVTIKGGTVTATGGEAEYSSGIYADAGDITISGGTVTATGGEAEYSSGIDADGVTISGGTVTATGGKAATNSRGIDAYTNVTISGGTVTATGGETTHDSWGSNGIDADGVTISGGTVTATGGKAAANSCGIYAYTNVTITGGTLTVTAGTAEQISCGIYGYTNVTITGGTVTATGGEAEYSCGIDSDGVTISGGTVTATGGKAATNSYGIYAINNVTISGGHVTAQTVSTTATTESALNVAPDLSSYTGYRWRTSASGDFTSSADTAYTYRESDTYVEFSNGYTYTITLDSNYEDGESSTVVTGTDGKLSELPAPTRDGYTFEGWFTESGAAAVTTATVFAQDTVLYAHWTYGFKFKINGQDVTADNIDSFTTTGSISYDATTKTLTLTNATIAGTALDENTTSILNCGDAVKTICLVGKNVITGSGEVTNPRRDYHYYYYGIGTEKSLTITGSSRDDSLTITLPAWTCNDNIAYYAKVTRGISVGASGSTDKLTIQNCTLDVVCAGATNQSSDVYAIYADCMIQIDNAKVNAFAGKNRDGSITETRKGIAICASGRTLEISDSDITAGAFSNSTSDKVPQDFAALEGGSIKLTGCTLDLAAEAPNAVLPVSALHTTYAYNDVVNITNCEGTLHGSDYGIHIDPSSGTTITAYPVFTKSDLIITAFNGESNPGDAVKITGYDSTLGYNPKFNDVIVKAGANESTATLYSNPNSSSVLAFWTFPYLSLTVDRTPPTLTAGSVTRDSEAAATVKFTSNEAGEYYYAVVESGADEPEIDTNVEWISCGTAQQTISLTDLSGAGAKDIYIAAKDAMGNVSEKLKIEIPAYVAPIYSISASPATLCFSSRQVGYTDKPKVTVTITNTGNQEIGSLSLQLKENSEYRFGMLSATRLDAGKTATATISPNTGLSAGTHVETLTITGRNNDNNVDVSTSVTLFFVVTEADHSHTYGEDWVTDTDSHWHACSCGERADFAEHTASDWIVDEPATAVDHGRKHKECTACGYQMESALIPAGTTYPVTVSGSFADTTGEGNYYYDETVNISAGTRSGYTFTGWTSDDVVITNASSADASFTMPGKAVTVTANWKSNSSGGSSGGGGVSTYAITVESAKNGAVTVSPKSASKGSTVTLTVTPDKGYTLETLTVTDASGKEVKLTGKNGKYTFTMPAGKVKVEATFMEDNSMLNFFVDVPADAYYYDAVLWAAENGITGGVDDTHFAPNAPCTRAQIVTFLWRAAGSPEPESVSSFADVPADSYYAKAVAWAVENGITTGTGDGMFSPNATCTRAQAMTFIWRSQKSVAAAGANPFTDVAADAYYAGAVQWAVENGVTNGTSDTTFSPNTNCTRAQIVTFLYRCLG